MVADSKKCQTLINKIAIVASDLKVKAAELEAWRARYLAANPDPTGTALEGNVATVNNWIDSVRAVADHAVADGMIAAIVPSHRGEAL